jgi:hypothetical protein
MIRDVSLLKELLCRDGAVTASIHLNKGVPGTKASNAAQNCAR